MRNFQVGGTVLLFDLGETNSWNNKICKIIEDNPSTYRLKRPDGETGLLSKGSQYMRFFIQDFENT